MVSGPEVFGENDVRVIVPTELREKVLHKVHGSRARGHWGVIRTAAMVRSKILLERMGCGCGVCRGQVHGL
jgi:Integrase zinc binding domain